jgi:hypothetical protein
MKKAAMPVDQFAAAKRYRETSWSVVELERQIERDKKHISEERAALRRLRPNKHELEAEHEKD